MKKTYEKKPHVMIDIETLGTGHNALICSIGAVVFKPDTGEVYRDSGFSTNIDWQSGVDAGREIEANTVRWWLTQSKEAIEALTNTENDVSWNIALKLFYEWMPKNHYVWSNGATCDISILENAYSKYNRRPPWEFRRVRDVRTIAHLAEELDIKTEELPEEKKHIAFEDACYQASYVSEMWQYLRSTKITE